MKNLILSVFAAFAAIVPASAQTTKVTIIWGDTLTFGAEGAFVPLNDPFTETVLPSRITSPLAPQIAGLTSSYGITAPASMGSDFSNNAFGNISVSEGMAYVAARAGEGSNRLIVNLSIPGVDCDPDGFWDATIWDQPFYRDGVTDNNWEGLQETIQAEIASLFALSPTIYEIDKVVFSAYNYGDNWTSVSASQTQGLATCDLITGLAAALPNVSVSPAVVRRPIARWFVDASAGLPVAQFNYTVMNFWSATPGPIYVPEVEDMVFRAADGITLNSFGMWLLGSGVGVSIL